MTEEEYEKSRYPRGITVNQLTGKNIKSHLIKKGIEPIAVPGNLNIEHYYMQIGKIPALLIRQSPGDLYMLYADLKRWEQLENLANGLTTILSETNL